MFILIGFAFVSGLLTIAAPCIWPILPVVLSSGATGGRSRPLGVTLGVMASFAFFTLTLSYVVRIIPFDPDVLRYFAVAVILLSGLALLIPPLNAYLESIVSRLAGRFSVRPTGGQDSGFVSGFVTGASLGIVWSPCAGPILATIITLASTRAVSGQLLLVTLAYVTGVGIPLFVFTLVGRSLLARSRALSGSTGRVQQVFGIVMILTALLIGTGYDRTIQASLLDRFPSYSQFLTGIESQSQVKQALQSLAKKPMKNTPGVMNPVDSTRAQMPLPDMGAAPEFAGIEHWLNPQKPLTMKDLRGKVVLIDFWTYTCINCIRTLPYVTSWYDKYHDKGFVVIGVHTPEFEFEKKTDNVLGAIKQYNIHYPVAQDNGYSTWNAYNNSYWPAEYLIDAKGHIRHTHFGEGEYDVTEKAIQTLLQEAGHTVSDSTVDQKDTTPHGRMTPETYLGSRRAQPNDYVHLDGKWNDKYEYIESGSDSTLSLDFSASKVFLVITPPKTGVVMDLTLDGKSIGSYAGSDVHDGRVTLDAARLYNLVDLHGPAGSHTLKIHSTTEGIQLFAFTFG